AGERVAAVCRRGHRYRGHRAADDRLRRHHRRGPAGHARAGLRRGRGTGAAGGIGQGGRTRHTEMMQQRRADNTMTRTPAPDDPRPAPQPGSSIHSCSGATSVRAHMRFHHLPDDDAQCAWYAMLPEPPPASRLEGAHSADWIVLGGGLTGLAAARRLAMLRPQSRIALIDAQRIGYGAAGRNSGFMIDLPHHLNSHRYPGRLEADRRLIRRNRAAIDYLRDIVHGHAIECDWREQGKIHAAATNAGAAALAAFMQGLDRLDEPYTQLD